MKYFLHKSALFAHLGKHIPLLLTETDNLPSVVRNYIINVNPHKDIPDMPPYVHGYILGSLNDITIHK